MGGCIVCVRVAECQAPHLVRLCEVRHFEWLRWIDRNLGPNIRIFGRSLSRQYVQARPPVKRTDCTTKELHRLSVCVLHSTRARRSKLENHWRAADMKAACSGPQCSCRTYHILFSRWASFTALATWILYRNAAYTVSCFNRLARFLSWKN